MVHASPRKAQRKASVFICVHLWFQRFFFASLALLALAPTANAYCIHNELKNREVVIEQEEHPDALRNDRRMRVTIAPGGKQCCDFRQLDCNPGGRENSVVGLAVTVAGEPEYSCGFADRKEPFVKVTGAGTIRIQPNPRHTSHPVHRPRRTPARARTSRPPPGLACLESKKGK